MAKRRRDYPGYVRKPKPGTRTRRKVNNLCSNPRLFIFPDGAVFHKTEKVFLDQVKIDGYMHYVFKRHTIAAHRLVATKFCNGKYRLGDDVLVVDHIDAQKCNNNAENLRWMTPQENKNQYFQYQRDDFIRQPCGVS